METMPTPRTSETQQPQHPPPPTPTSSATEFAGLEATQVALATQAAQLHATLEVISCGSYVDIGDLRGEEGHELEGWAGRWREQPRSPSGDTTFRYQLLQGRASLKLCITHFGFDHEITTEVQDYGCDDSFEIYVNGFGPRYEFAGTRSNIVRVHSFPVPSMYLRSYVVTVEYRNTAADTCGAAGVYNVRLEPAD